MGSESNSEHAIGTRVSGLIPRTISQCLNCQELKCEGCPKNDKAKKHEEYLRRKERKKWAVVQNAVEKQLHDQPLQSQVG